MKYWIWLFLLMHSFSLKAQDDKDFAIKATIKDILQFIENKDSSSINEYIHPEDQLYILYRMGAHDIFQKVDNITFNSEIYPYNLLDAYATYSDNKLDLEPEYNCDSMQYPSGIQGIYIEPIHSKKLLLSQIAKEMHRYDNLSRQELEKAIKIDEESIRIVIIDKDQRVVIFYLFYKGDKWWMSMIDLVTTDCSA